MKRQRGPKKLKRVKLDYELIGKKLRQFCNNDNGCDVSEAGPYAQTALSLSWSNSIRNRKYLQVIWKGNRGHVQDSDTSNTQIDTNDNIEAKDNSLIKTKDHVQVSDRLKTQTVEQDNIEAKDTSLRNIRGDVPVSNRPKTQTVEKDNSEAKDTSLRKIRGHVQVSDRSKTQTVEQDNTEAKDTSLRKNRDHVQVSDLSKTQTVENDNSQAKDNSLRDKRKRLSLDRKQKPINISSDENDDSSDNFTRSTRKSRKRKLPFTPTTKPTPSRKYCICANSYTDIDDGRMVECQSCNQWYHCSCLTLPTIPPDMTGKQLRFKCGRKTCNNGEFYYRLKGKSIVPQEFILQDEPC